MQVGNIVVAKDMPSVFERTIGVPLNERLKRVSGEKSFVSYLR
jgi:hypothetical protein